MKINYLQQLINGLALGIAVGVITQTACGQIYVANIGTSALLQYNFDGTLANPTLLTGLNHPDGIAFAGGNIYVANSGSRMIAEYTTAGAPVNTNLVGTLNSSLRGLVVSGGSLYVAENQATVNVIGKYNAVSGAAVNAALVTGLGGPVGLALSGPNLYVANSTSGTIGEYDATTGAAIHASLVSGLSGPFGLAISGNELYVVNQNAGTIGVYDAISGAAINTTLVSGLSLPTTLALSGGDLFVVNQTGGTVGEYDATTGAAINKQFITGLSSPTFIDIENPVSAPEPSTFCLLTGVGLFGLALRGRFWPHQA